MATDSVTRAVREFRDSASGASSTEIRETLRMIAKDMQDDAAAFDGKPFNGRNVGTQFGNHGAAIAALCTIVERLTDVVERLIDRDEELAIAIIERPDPVS